MDNSINNSDSVLMLQIAYPHVFKLHILLKYYFVYEPHIQIALLHSCLYL